MMRLLFFWSSFILMLSIEWIAGRFFAPWDIVPPLSAALTVTWGLSDPWPSRIWRLAPAGILIDSVSSLPFGSYTTAILLAGLITWFLHFVISNPTGLVKKNIIAVSGMMIFVITVLTASSLLAHMGGWVSMNLSASIQVLFIGILWALFLPVIFNGVFSLLLPARLRPFKNDLRF